MIVEIIFVAVALLFALAITLLILLARKGYIESAPLLAMAALCLVVLFLMNVTDWPWEVLTQFWRDHAVVSSTVSTLLLIGVGFLAFEVRDVKQQQRIDESITVAGHAGLVDYLIGVEVALALVQQPAPPDDEFWAGWSNGAPPLRWLREHEEKLRRKDGKPNQDDPRRLGPALPADLEGPVDWRLNLVDQCVRRVISGIKGWAPVVSRSRLGLDTLVAFGKLRNRLLVLADLLDASDDRADLNEAARLLTSLRGICRANAWTLENGVREARAEVLEVSGDLVIDDTLLQRADATAYGRDGDPAARRLSLKEVLR